jgi:flagellar hook-basal body complex protein FliE
MAMPINAATSAYANASKLIDQQMKGGSPFGGQSTGQTPDFAQLLSQAVQGVVDTGKVSDQKSLDLVNGKGNLVDVVTSVAQTQVAVEGLVAVRDRVISAYEDIMKMPI